MRNLQTDSCPSLRLLDRIVCRSQIWFPFARLCARSSCRAIARAMSLDKKGHYQNYRIKLWKKKRNAFFGDFSVDECRRFPHPVVSPVENQNRWNRQKNDFVNSKSISSAMEGSFLPYEIPERYRLRIKVEPKIASRFGRAKGGWVGRK